MEKVDINDHIIKLGSSGYLRIVKDNFMYYQQEFINIFRNKKEKIVNKTLVIKQELDS